jgi:hypothetical protein
LGPNGNTLKRIERDTGCQIMIRGIGSSRPTTPFNSGSVFFDRGYSYPQYGSLHVLIQCNDTPNRAKIRINTALSVIDALLAPIVSC